jgi:hypothetical protein
MAGRSGGVKRTYSESSADGGAPPDDNRSVYSRTRTPCNGLEIRVVGGQTYDLRKHSYLEVYVPWSAFKEQKSPTTFADIDTNLTSYEAVYKLLWLMAFVNENLCKADRRFPTHVMIETVVHRSVDIEVARKGVSLSDVVGMRVRLAFSVYEEADNDKPSDLIGDLHQIIADEQMLTGPAKTLGNIILTHFSLINEAVSKLSNRPVVAEESSDLAALARKLLKLNRFANAREAKEFLARNDTIRDASQLSLLFAKYGQVTRLAHLKDPGAIGMAVARALSLTNATRSTMHRMQQVIHSKEFGVPELVHVIPSHEFYADNFHRFLFPFLTKSVPSRDAVQRTLNNAVGTYPDKMYERVSMWLHMMKENKENMQSEVMMRHLRAFNIEPHDVKDIFWNFRLEPAHEFYEPDDPWKAVPLDQCTTEKERQKWASRAVRMKLLRKLFNLVVFFLDAADVGSDQRGAANDLEREGYEFYPIFEALRRQVTVNADNSRTRLIVEALEEQKVNPADVMYVDVWNHKLNGQQRLDIQRKVEEERCSALSSITLEAIGRADNNFLFGNNPSNAQRAVRKWLEEQMYKTKRGNFMCRLRQLWWTDLSAFGSRMALQCLLYELAGHSVSHVQLLDSYICNLTASEEGYGIVDPLLKANHFDHGGPGTGKSVNSNAAKNDLIDGTVHEIDGFTAKSILQSFTKSKVDNSLNCMVLKLDDMPITSFQTTQVGGGKRTGVNDQGEERRSSYTDTSGSAASEVTALFQRIMTGKQVHGGGRMEKTNDKYLRDEGVHFLRVVLQANANFPIPSHTAFASRVRQKLVVPVDRPGNNPHEMPNRSAAQGDLRSAANAELKMLTSRDQAMVFRVNHMIKAGAIQPLDMSFAQPILTKIFADAGLLMDDDGFSVNRSMDRVLSAAHVCTILSAVAKVLDNPLTCKVAEKPWSTPDVIRRMEPHLVVDTEHLVFALSMFASSHFHPHTQLVVRTIHRILEDDAQGGPLEYLHIKKGHATNVTDTDRYTTLQSVPFKEAAYSADDAMPLVASMLKTKINRDEGISIDVSSLEDCLRRMSHIRYRLPALAIESIDQIGDRVVQALNVSIDSPGEAESKGKEEMPVRVRITICKKMINEVSATNPLEKAIETNIGKCISKDMKFLMCVSSGYLPYVMKTKVIKKITVKVPAKEQPRGRRRGQPAIEAADDDDEMEAPPAESAVVPAHAAASAVDTSPLLIRDPKYVRSPLVRLAKMVLQNEKELFTTSPNPNILIANNLDYLQKINRFNVCGLTADERKQVVGFTREEYEALMQPEQKSTLSYPESLITAAVDPEVKQKGNIAKMLKRAADDDKEGMLTGVGRYMSRVDEIDDVVDAPPLTVASLKLADKVDTFQMFLLQPESANTIPHLRFANRPMTGSELVAARASIEEDEMPDAATLSHLLGTLTGAERSARKDMAHDGMEVEEGESVIEGLKSSAVREPARKRVKFGQPLHFDQLQGDEDGDNSQPIEWHHADEDDMENDRIARQLAALTGGGGGGGSSSSIESSSSGLLSLRRATGRPDGSSYSRM